MPLPPSAPLALRIFERAMCPQITAGIAVNSQPQVNERTAKMRLQIATAGVRGTVCGTTGDGGGCVSSAIAPFVMNLDGKSKTHCRKIESGGHPIDPRLSARSPATLADLTVHLAVPDRSILLRQAAFRRALPE